MKRKCDHISQSGTKNVNVHSIFVVSLGLMIVNKSNKLIHLFSVPACSRV